MSKLIYIIALLFVGLLLLCAIFLYREKYVDVQTGRMRCTFVLGSFEVSDAVIETELSKVWKKLNGEYPAPLWEQESRTRAIYPGASPHFGHHGVFGWQNAITIAFETTEFQPEIQATVLSNYFALLASRPLEAQQYATKVLDLATSELGGVTKTNAPSWIVSP